MNTKCKITRKSMLYKTGVEYGDYTMNHVLGCSHGCKYPCYAFMMAKRFGKVKTYEEWTTPCLVSNTLELLDQEIPKLRDRISSVQLCFTTDPFMYGYEDIEKMSFDAIGKLNDAGIKCVVLTKGVLPSKLSEHSNHNEYGITLVSLDEEFRSRIEPGSAGYENRVASLRNLHESGCKTWVSIEPYPTPNIIKQDFNKILNAVAFVDRIIFGRTNYNKEITAYGEHKMFFNERANEVISFCNSHSIQYHIKNGTITPQNLKNPNS